MTDTTALPPTGLLVEMLRDPEGAVIHTATPRFGWIVNDQIGRASCRERV